MKFYTCKEIADRYNVKTGTVWAWIRRGEMNAMKMGKEYRVSEIDIQKYEAAHRKAG